MHQAAMQHTTTPESATDDLGSALVEAKAFTRILTHISASSTPVTRDEVMVIANGLDRSVSAIDRAVSAALKAWRADKTACADRITLLLANLELTGEQAARLAAIAGVEPAAQ